MSTLAGVVLMVLFFAHPVWAQPDLGLTTVGEATGLAGTDIRVIVARIIQVALGLIGVISLVIILYGGFLWMTSGGDEGKIDTAKKVMINWAIGLLIIVLAFGIVTFVLRALGYGSGSLFGGNNDIPFTFGRGALGNGIIESHYPARGAHCLGAPPATTGCIPRNTLIVVTFKEPMNVETIAGEPIDDVNFELNTDNVKIFASDATADDQGESQALGAADVQVRVVGERTFVFEPVSYLGSPSERMYYTVKLTNGIETSRGEAAFAANGANSYYQWDFEVGTFIDLAPPRVESVYPSPGNIEPRNVVVQINFNEAVDPTTVSTASNVDEEGQLTFDRIKVVSVAADATETPVAGSFSIANQYRTVEFTTTDLCGENSCGEDVYCLPGNANLKVIVKAAALEPSSEPDVPAGPTARWVPDVGYDGVTDMAANSLNGNGENGEQCAPVGGTGLNCFGDAVADGNHCDCAIGPTADNYFWSFQTNNTIDIAAPIIEMAAPTVGVFAPVSVADPVQALFNKVLMARSIVGGVTVTLASDGNQVLIDGELYDENLPFWPTMTNQDRDGDGYRDDQSQVDIQHDPYQRAEIDQARFDYASYYGAGVRDIYQNCYFPSGAGSGVAGGCLPGDTSPSCCNDIISPACPRPLWPEWPDPKTP